MFEETILFLEIDKFTETILGCSWILINWLKLHSKLCPYVERKRIFGVILDLSEPVLTEIVVLDRENSNLIFAFFQAR